MANEGQMLVRTFYFFCVVACSFALVEGDNGMTKLQYSLALDSEETIHLQWKTTRKMITFKVSAPTTGWVGLGFSYSGSMKGADIMLGWIKDGRSHVLDMHSVENGLPALDDKQNIRSSKVEENGTHTSMLITRYLDTCDKEHDFVITEDTTRVIYAYGQSDPDGDVPTTLNYHGAANRGVRSIRLLYRPLRRVEERDMDDSIKTYDLLSAPFMIPKRDTYYNCFYHKLPELNEKHHLIQIEAVITPGNTKNVHHITMYHCNESMVTDEMLANSTECYTNDGGKHWRICAPIVFSWAVGMTSVTLPKHVGMPLGEPGTPKIVKLEVHYDNLDAQEGIVDNSGFRLFYTTKLRKHDAGILLTGHDVWPSLFVPPGSEDFLVQGHCPKQCLSQTIAEAGFSQIQVFGVILHAHTASSGMVMRHYRNGTELRPIAKDIHYDFDYQEMKLLSKEVAVTTEDNLVMECLYDTRKRTLPTLGGLGTRDEMCFGFLLYYPKIDMAFCQTSPRYKDTYAALGATNVEQAVFNGMMKNWDDESRMEFNDMQLNAPLIYMCRRFSGPLEGKQNYPRRPAVTAPFVEKPGRCELNQVKKKLRNAIGKRDKRQITLAPEITTTQDDYYQETEVVDNYITIGIAISSSAVIFLVLVIIYNRLK